MTSTNLESQTLRHYLRNHLFALGAIVTIVYGIPMSTLYDWGLDDASEFYLYQDAEDAAELIRMGQGLPENTSFKHYYLGIENLPSRYQVLFQTQTKNSTENEISEPNIRHIEEGETFEYVLQYPLLSQLGKSKKTSLFVIHCFNLTEDQNLPGLSIAQVVLIISIIGLSFVLLSSTLIYNTINRAILAFYDWGKALGDLGSAAKPENIPLEKIRFKELQTVGSTLENSVQKILDLTEREKSFVRCLSHELRTPMAVVSAALDILDRKEIPNEINAKLQKIRTANRSMILTSDTLLNIWQNQRTNALPEQIPLRSLVSEILNDNQYRTSREPLVLNNEISPELLFNLQKEPLNLVVSNLIKNAMQYAAGNSVNITATDTRITITNDCNDAQKGDKPMHSEYGYGLGLFIAETVAKQQGWSLLFEQKPRLFIAELRID